MKCKKCGTECSDNSNFCNSCGSKLKKVCNCWIKKEPYNCGTDKCPGYKLFKSEKNINVRKVEGMLSESELIFSEESKVKKEDIPCDKKGMPIFNHQLG